MVTVEIPEANLASVSVFCDEQQAEDAYGGLDDPTYAHEVVGSAFYQVTARQDYGPSGQKKPLPNPEPILAELVAAGSG